MGDFLKGLSKPYKDRGVLSPYLDNWFATADFPDELVFTVHMNKEKDDAFHPSSAYGCAREVYGRRVGDISYPALTGVSYKNFMYGHFSHEIIQYVLVHELKFAKPEDIEKEYYFRNLKTAKGNSYSIRGFTDVARCRIPNSKEYLVDIKTVNARIFAQDQLPLNTWNKYVAQVQLYLEFEDVDECILLCSEKDTPHRFKEYIVPRDGDAVDSIITKWESVVDALAEGVVPDCTCDDPDTCPARDVYAYSGD